VTACRRPSGGPRTPTGCDSTAHGAARIAASLWAYAGASAACKGSETMTPPSTRPACFSLRKAALSSPRVTPSGRSASEKSTRATSSVSLQCERIHLSARSNRDMVSHATTPNVFEQIGRERSGIQPTSTPPRRRESPHRTRCRRHGQACLALLPTQPPPSPRSWYGAPESAGTSCGSRA